VTRHAPPAGPGPAAASSVERDVVYAARPDGHLRADIYRPVGAGPHPGVLVVHAGSWQRGDRRDMARVAERLAAGGFVAVSIDYRLAPAHPFPAALDDCRDALRWMRARADVLDIEPARIGAFGYSAGGHLVALLATTGETDERPRAVVAGGAPTDLRRLGFSPAVRRFLGGGPDAVPQMYAAASPILHVSADDPPMLLYHGRSDWLVGIGQATAMRDALRAAGVPVAYHETELGHFATFFFDDEPFSAALGFLDVWLENVHS
jgi:acetyl esterase/lipase